MAEIIIKNLGSLVAVYDGEPVSFTTNEVSTVVVQGITATKAADKEYWVNGPLTYTIVVTNNSGMALSGLVLTDNINIITTFDTDFGVQINGAASVYTVLSNVLNVSLPTLADGESVTVVFRVLQV